MYLFLTLVFFKCLCQLVRAGCAAHSAGDPRKFFYDIVDLHARCQLGYAFVVAVATANKVYTFYAIIFDFNFDDLSANFIVGIVNIFHSVIYLPLQYCWCQIPAWSAEQNFSDWLRGCQSNRNVYIGCRTMQRWYCRRADTPDR